MDKKDSNVNIIQPEEKTSIFDKENSGLEKFEKKKSEIEKPEKETNKPEELTRQQENSNPWYKSKKKLGIVIGISILIIIL
jgi:hypothetical protein